MITITTHRQLNDLIADKVMSEGFLKSIWLSEIPLFGPATDMNAAMQVFEEAELTGIEHDRFNDRWRAVRWLNKVTEITLGNTACLAICMAALNAKGIDAEWRPEA